MLTYNIIQALAQNKLYRNRLKTSVEPVIAKDAGYSYRYARDILHGPFKLGEAAIAKDAGHSFWYAKDILHGPFKLGEKAIAKITALSYYYARNVLRLSTDQVDSWRASWNKRNTKKAYGYDISGDVADDKQLNMHDLHLLNTEANPQQYSQSPENSTLPKSAILYTLLSSQEIPQHQMTLYATPEMALQEDSRHASFQGQEGVSRIFQLKFGDIADLQLLPAWDYHQDGTWQASYHDTGRFVVIGDLSDLNSRLKPVKC